MPNGSDFSACAIIAKLATIASTVAAVGQNRVSPSEYLRPSAHEFKKNVHFESCRINTLNLTRSRYEWLFLHWDSVNHLEKDEQAHQKLIDNYERLQWETDSSECRLACSNETAAEPAIDYSWIMGLLDIDRLAKGFALLPDRGADMDDGNAWILL